MSDVGGFVGGQRVAPVPLYHDSPWEAEAQSHLSLDFQEDKQQHKPQTMRPQRGLHMQCKCAALLSEHQMICTIVFSKQHATLSNLFGQILTELN